MTSEHKSESNTRVRRNLPSLSHSKMDIAPDMEEIEDSKERNAKKEAPQPEKVVMRRTKGLPTEANGDILDIITARVPQGRRSSRGQRQSISNRRPTHGPAPVPEQSAQGVIDPLPLPVSGYQRRTRTSIKAATAATVAAPLPPAESPELLPLLQLQRSPPQEIPQLPPLEEAGAVLISQHAQQEQHELPTPPGITLGKTNATPDLIPAQVAGCVPQVPQVVAPLQQVAAPESTPDFSMLSGVPDLHIVLASIPTTLNEQDASAAALLPPLRAHLAALCSHSLRLEARLTEKDVQLTALRADVAALQQAVRVGAVAPSSQTVFTPIPTPAPAQNEGSASGGPAALYEAVNAHATRLVRHDREIDVSTQHIHTLANRVVELRTVTNGLDQQQKTSGAGLAKCQAEVAVLKECFGELKEEVRGEMKTLRDNLVTGGGGGGGSWNALQLPSPPF